MFYFVEEETKGTPSKGGVKPAGCGQTLSCSTLLSPKRGADPGLGSSWTGKYEVCLVR